MGTVTFSGPSETTTATEDPWSTWVPAAGLMLITCLSGTLSLCCVVNVGFSPASRRVFSAVVLSIPVTWGTLTCATCSTCWSCHHRTPSTVPPTSSASTSSSTTGTTHRDLRRRRSYGAEADAGAATGAGSSAAASSSNRPYCAETVGSASSLRPAAVTAAAGVPAPTAGRVLV